MDFDHHSFISSSSSRVFSLQNFALFFFLFLRIKYDPSWIFNSHICHAINISMQITPIKKYSTIDGIHETVTKSRIYRCFKLVWFMCKCVTHLWYWHTVKWQDQNQLDICLVAINILYFYYLIHILMSHLSVYFRAMFFSLELVLGIMFKVSW